MITAWYVIVSAMLIIYVVLDGRNFGAGMLHLLVARTQGERRQVIAAIGPLWSWHEVWLVGFGGTLMAAFPRLMASAFSGYYLALFLIIWSLILRGVSIQVGGEIEDGLWQKLWDFVFSASNFLLAVLFGVALGNVGRGVPIDATGDFSMAFFTSFGVRGNVGLLDWYTVSVAIFAVVLLAAHGATYLELKTQGPVHDRSAFFGRRLWLAVLPLLVAISFESWIVRPAALHSALRQPLCWVGVVVIGASAVALAFGLCARLENCAFIASNFLIVGLLAVGGAAIFPVMLYSTLGPQYSLTAYAVSANHPALMIASYWWPVGFALAVTYFVFISRHYAGKVDANRDSQDFY
jgi:cytochrome bd ubiquinol oxidase subunit II